MLQNQCGLLSGPVDLRRKEKTLHAEKSALPEVLSPVALLLQLVTGTQGGKASAQNEIQEPYSKDCV